MILWAQQSWWSQRMLLFIGHVWNRGTNFYLVIGKENSSCVLVWANCAVHTDNPMENKQTNKPFQKYLRHSSIQCLRETQIANKTYWKKSQEIFYKRVQTTCDPLFDLHKVCLQLTAPCPRSLLSQRRHDSLCTIDITTVVQGNQCAVIRHLFWPCISRSSQCVNPTWFNLSLWNLGRTLSFMRSE